jgi:hypothetical protein
VPKKDILYRGAMPMDTTSILILLASILGFLLFLLYSDEINGFIERKLDQATKYATEIQILLATVLGVILTQLVGAVLILNLVKIVIFGGIMVLIILFIFDIRRRDKDRQQLMDSQYTKNLTTLIEGSLRRVLKEERKQIKKEIKQAFREDRKQRQIKKSENAKTGD